MSQGTEEAPRLNVIEVLTQNRNQAREAIFSSVVKAEPDADGTQSWRIEDDPQRVNKLKSYVEAEVDLAKRAVEAASPGFDTEADRTLMLYQGALPHFEHPTRESEVMLMRVLWGMYDVEGGKEWELVKNGSKIQDLEWKSQVYNVFRRETLLKRLWNELFEGKKFNLERP